MSQNAFVAAGAAAAAVLFLLLRGALREPCAHRPCAR